MIGDIIKNPKNIKCLARQIQLLCDGYWERSISEIDAIQMTRYWASTEAKKLFKAAEYNPTVLILIGKKRADLLSKWLSGFQIKL